MEEMGPSSLEARRAFAARIAEALSRSVHGSVVELLGSLATGTDDAFSDIDLRWDVPDEQFEGAVARVSDYLSGSGEVTSLRVDPDFALSAKRRLVYARFAHVPLFWRLDLDIMARSIEGDDDYDRGNPGARDAASWSLTESALMNAIAAAKALARGNEDLASDLLRRGYERAGLPRPASANRESVQETCSRGGRERSSSERSGGPDRGPR